MASTISGGRPKRTFSGITSSSCTLPKPLSARNFTVSSTRHSGAEAPAVSAMVFDVFQPIGLDVVVAVNEMRLRAEIARHFNQAVGIGTIFRADDQQQISFRSDLLHGYLTIFGGVADILRRRALDVRELLPQGRDDVFGLVETKRGLRKKRDAIRIGHGQRFLTCSAIPRPE